jgi:hypothetical protein
MITYAILWPTTIIATLIVNRATQAAGAAQKVIAIGPAIAMLGWRAIVAPIVFGTVVLTISFFLPPPVDGFFAGGFAFSQLAGLGSGIRSLLYLKALAKPNLAKGHVDYSSEMRYRLLSAEMLAFAVIFAGLAATLQRMDCAGAALFQASTSLGYWRRAGQAAARSAGPLVNSGGSSGPPSVS